MMDGREKPLPRNLNPDRERESWVLDPDAFLKDAEALLAEAEKLSDPSEVEAKLADACVVVQLGFQSIARTQDYLNAHERWPAFEARFFEVLQNKRIKAASTDPNSHNWRAIFKKLHDEVILAHQMKEILANDMKLNTPLPLPSSPDIE